MFKQILFIALLCFQQSANAQNKIVVAVNNFRDNKGICIVGLYNNALSFSGRGEPVRRTKVLVLDHAARVEFDDVAAGTYAIAVIHDANSNGQFDCNFAGIPKEGYGASQNKLPFAGAPKFDENKFVVRADAAAVINIKLRYLL